MLTDRRQFIQGTAAGFAASMLPVAAFASSTSAPAASRFFDAIGINVHPGWLGTNTSWGTQDWPSRLSELGVLQSRGFLGHSKAMLPKMQAFFDAGGRHCTTVVQSSTGGTLDRTAAKHNIDFAASLPISGLEGPNEFNKGHPSDWATTLRDFMEWMHDAVRGRAPVVAPSIWSRILADYQALGDISAYVEKGCIHFYSGGHRPTKSNQGTMEDELREAQIIAPGKPQFMTETGWKTNQVSERAQAKYVLRNYFDAFGYDVEKVHTYELMDDNSNLYGLCTATTEPKPAFYALKNLAALFRDSGGGEGNVSFEVSEAPASLKLFPFRRSIGEYLLALYLDVESYDLKTMSDIETSAPVTILFPSSVSGEIYQPTFNSSPVKSFSGPTLSLSVPDDVTVLRFV
jgi:hypothetical protein